MSVLWLDAMLYLHSCCLRLEDGDILDRLESCYASGAHARRNLTPLRVSNISGCEHTRYVRSACARLRDDVALAVQLDLAV